MKLVNVFRGGSWLYGAGICRSAYRAVFGPSLRGGILGFRLTAQIGKKEMEGKVIKGGSWHYVANYSRPASRDWGDPSNSGGLLGFRLVCVLQSETRGKKMKYRVHYEIPATVGVEIEVEADSAESAGLVANSHFSSKRLRRIAGHLCDPHDEAILAYASRTGNPVTYAAVACDVQKEFEIVDVYPVD